MNFDGTFEVNATSEKVFNTVMDPNEVSSCIPGFKMNPKPSSLDFYAFIQNYSSIISGSFIKKVYQVDETDFLLQLYSSTSGKNYLLISLKKGLAFC